MSTYRRKSDFTIVEAIQFDPKQHPWPCGVHPWPHPKGFQPRNMSWGYLDEDGHNHVWAENWIVTESSGEQLAYSDTDFQTRFEPVLQVATPETEHVPSPTSESHDDDSLVGVIEDISRRIFVEELAKRRPELMRQMQADLLKEMRLRRGMQ